MSRFTEILTFRRMIAPVVLQILFWAGIGGVLYGSYVLFRLDSPVWPFPLIFGSLLVRVLFELSILAFRSYDRLGEIRDRIAALEKAE